MTALAKINTEERDARLWTADHFLQFYTSRPDEERWQLVDGIPMMMVPPGYRHQLLAGNFYTILKAALQSRRPDLITFYETGVRIPGAEDFNPTPDLIVFERQRPFDRYCEHFLLAAEVLSPSNTAEMIERKLELYQSHPENLYCLAIDQDSVHVRLHAREDGWRRVDLRGLGDRLLLPAFGFEASLADIYAGTPLAGPG